MEHRENEGISGDVDENNEPENRVFGISGDIIENKGVISITP